jgi:hypothetical protein
LAGEAGWRRIFDRYRISSVIADKRQQRPFIRMIRSDTEWQIRYEDEQAILFVKRPAVTRPRKSSAQSDSSQPDSAKPSQPPQERAQP